MLWRKALSVISFVCYVHTSESIRWPTGTYGIPKPASGCPLADGFQWQEGWRSQVTNSKYSNNSKSAEFHLDGIVDKKEVQRSFCIKTSTSDNNRPNWPAGQYCVYKKGQCPTGLKSGYVYWDDHYFYNENDKGGTLPDGKYNSNTKIYFCCKIDGDKDVPILLPSESPFFLLAYKSAKCQMVKWAIATVEWIYYDTAHWNNGDKAVDAYPFEAGKSHPTIYYCYYRGCNETLTTTNGSFQSPNYPRNYPYGQYCSWKIMVNTTQQIHLVFTNFSLQNENNTDALHVYDGENMTGEVLGVFYGGHPPPQEGIYSLSNKIFLIFKSDKTDSYKGFSAFYYAVYKSGPSVTTTQPPDISDMTTSSSFTLKTANTLETTAFAREPTSTIHGPTREGGEKKERKQHRENGFNMVAVIVPVVFVVFLVAGIAAFFYCKRKRTKKDAKPDEVMFSARSSDESPILLENPYYDRNVVVANAKQPNFSEENEMYTDVKEPEKLNKTEPYEDLENENPLYEGADANDVVLNPIYDSELVMTNTQGSSFCEGNELYTDVEEPDENNEKKLYTEQESDNPLYEVAGTDDAAFNPIYDSSI